MPAEIIYQSVIRTPSHFGIPRDLLMLAMAPVIMMVPLAIITRNWLLLVYAVLGAIGAVAFLGAICARNPRIVHQWAHSISLPRRMLAKQNLRGRQVSHR